MCRAHTQGSPPVRLHQHTCQDRKDCTQRSRDRQHSSQEHTGCRGLFHLRLNRSLRCMTYTLNPPMRLSRCCTCRSSNYSLYHRLRSRPPPGTDRTRQRHTETYCSLDQVQTRQGTADRSGCSPSRRGSRCFRCMVCSSLLTARPCPRRIQQQHGRVVSEGPVKGA